MCQPNDTKVLNGNPQVWCGAAACCHHHSSPTRLVHQCGILCCSIVQFVSCVCAWFWWCCLNHLSMPMPCTLPTSWLLTIHHHQVACMHHTWHLVAMLVLCFQLFLVVVVHHSVWPLASTALLVHLVVLQSLPPPSHHITTLIVVVVVVVWWLLVWQVVLLRKLHLLLLQCVCMHPVALCGRGTHGHASVCVGLCVMARGEVVVNATLPGLGVPSPPPTNHLSQSNQTSLAAPCQHTHNVVKGVGWWCLWCGMLVCLCFNTLGAMVNHHHHHCV